MTKIFYSNSTAIQTFSKRQPKKLLHNNVSNSKGRHENNGMYAMWIKMWEIVVCSIMYFLRDEGENFEKFKIGLCNIFRNYDRPFIGGLLVYINVMYLLLHPACKSANEWCVKANSFCRLSIFLREANIWLYKDSLQTRVGFARHVVMTEWVIMALACLHRRAGKMTPSFLGNCDRLLQYNYVPPSWKDPEKTSRVIITKQNLSLTSYPSGRLILSDIIF